MGIIIIGICAVIGFLVGANIICLPGSAHFMETNNLVIWLAVVFVPGLIIVIRMIHGKRLEEYLLKYGTEIEAEVKVVGRGGKGSNLLVEIDFQINGRQIRKRIAISSFEWRNPKEHVRKMPVLVDPFHPHRFLFNVRKFHLQKTSGDSIQNFQERCQAEHPDSEGKD